MKIVYLFVKDCNPYKITFNYILFIEQITEITTKYTNIKKPYRKRNNIFYK